MLSEEGIKEIAKKIAFVAGDAELHSLKHEHAIIGIIKGALKEEREAIADWVSGGCEIQSEVPFDDCFYYFGLISNQMRKLD